jgi:hypothetical protein
MAHTPTDGIRDDGLKQSHHDTVPQTEEVAETSGRGQRPRSFLLPVDGEDVQGLRQRRAARLGGPPPPPPTHPLGMDAPNDDEAVPPSPCHMCQPVTE